MGTAEILIVFSALMALIALVTIGIDWIGKPLKHRRFIPRIYRFDDEKLPTDAYGHTRLPTQAAASPPPGYGVGVQTHPAPHMQVRAPQPTQPPPVVVAHVDRSNETVRVPIAAEADPAPAASVAAAATSAPSTSAFSELLGPDSGEHSRIAGRTIAGQDADAPAATWQIGMAIDLADEGRKPSLAVKAERFWSTTANAMAASHFDDENLARMAAGKAPRRLNPRTGRTEAMQLTGLRQASTHDQVRMRWPDEAADPWAAS